MRARSREQFEGREPGWKGLSIQFPTQPSYSGFWGESEIPVCGDSLSLPGWRSAPLGLRVARVTSVSLVPRALRQETGCFHADSQVSLKGQSRRGPASRTPAPRAQQGRSGHRHRGPLAGWGPGNSPPVSGRRGALSGQTGHRPGASAPSGPGRAPDPAGKLLGGSSSSP